MNSRLFDRLAAVASMLILVGLALLSYFLAQQAERSMRQPAGGPPRHEPDYFVEQLRVLKVNAAGQPALRVAARRMRHYPDNDTVEFDSPRVMTLADDRPPIEIVADSGIGPDTGEKAELIGNVVIERAAGKDSPRLVARTTRATVLLDEKVIVTDQPVDIELGSSRLKGTGMRLDSQSRRLDVDANVRGQLAPRSTNDAAGDTAR